MPNINCSALHPSGCKCFSGSALIRQTLSDLHHGNCRFQVNTAPVIVNEIALVGSRCGPFEPALDLLERGAVDVSAMISETLRLTDAPRAFETAARKGVLKVLLAN